MVTSRLAKVVASLRRGGGRTVFVSCLSLAAAGAALAFACGPSASSDSYERTNHECVPGACPASNDAGGLPDVHVAPIDSSLEPWPDTDAGPLSGIYAIHAVENATIGPIPVSLQLLYRLRLLQKPADGGNTTQSLTLCALKLPSVPNIATITVPPRLTALIPQVSDVVSTGDFIGVEGGTQTYNPPPLLLVLGAKLKNPLTDPLPSLMDASTEWDEDMDGHPGVTAEALVPILCTTEEELYVALRTGGTLSGTFSGAGTLSGTMNVTVQESVIGFSDPCLAAAANLSPTIAPMTTFVAQLLADEATLDKKGDVSCADIVTMAPKLYGTEWTGDGGM